MKSASGCELWDASDQAKKTLRWKHEDGGFNHSRGYRWFSAAQIQPLCETTYNVPLAATGVE